MPVCVWGEGVAAVVVDVDFANAWDVDVLVEGTSDGQSSLWVSEGEGCDLKSTIDRGCRAVVIGEDISRDGSIFFCRFRFVWISPIVVGGAMSFFRATIRALVVAIVPATCPTPTTAG